MRRRTLISGLALLAGASVRGQTAGAAKRIGMLANVPVAADQGRWTVAPLLESSLRELGWVEGGNVTYEHRYAMQRTERYQALAAELVAARVDLLVVTGGVTAALAARRTTSTLPIVAIGIADPVKAGLVESYAHPGGNVTGSIAPLADWGKYIELAHEAVPSATRVAVIGNSSNVVYAGYAADNEKAARRLGLQLQMIGITSVDALDAAFEAMRRERAEVLVFGPDGLLTSNVRELIRRARAQHLPVIGPNRPAAVEGALLTYGPDVAEIARQGATYIDRILRGARPADLPIEQITRFELVVNAKVARDFGLALPRALLVRADDVID
jgi:putative ABC transport system substrate-binding protein